MKKSICFYAFFVIVFLTVFCSAAAMAETHNILSNGGFEQLSDDGLPEDWYTCSYHTQDGYSKLSVTGQIVHSGNYAVCIENAELNDARFVCTADVEPQTMYCLSCYVYIDYMNEEGNGANIALEDFCCVSTKLYTTANDWQQLCWYGETGPDQYELTFSVRVGGFGAESIGKAYFDDVSLIKTETLPEEIIADLWYEDVQTSSVSASSSEKTETKPYLLVCIAVAFLLFFAVLFYLLPCKKSLSVYIIIAGFVLALLLRIYLSGSIYGYSVDIGCFSAWSERIASVGPSSFYTDDYFCDYPPGMILLLWPVGFALKNHQYGTSVYLILLKLLPVLCDLAGALTLFLANRKNHSTSITFFAALLYLLNPAVLLNGAAWGQVDSIFSFLLLLAVIFSVKRKLRWAFPIYIAAVLIKPQALLAGPIALFWLAMLLWNTRHNQIDFKNIIKEAVLGIVLSVAVGCATVLPFASGKEHPLSWLVSLYSDTINSYDYVTINTANLYYLFGCNWVSLSEKLPVWLPVLTGILFAAAATLLLIRKKEKAISILFIVTALIQFLLLFVSATYREYGYVLMAFIYLWSVLYLLTKKSDISLSFLIAFVYIGLYVFGIKIHERYLFPALLLLLMSFLKTKDYRVLLPFVGFSCTTFLNSGIVLENSIVLGSSYGHLNTDTLFLNNLLAVINILLCGYCGFLMIDGLKETQRKIIFHTTPVKKEITSAALDKWLHPKDSKLHLRLVDYLSMLIVTLVYGVLTLSTLGSTVAPQTAWMSSNSEEEVVLSLEEETEFSILYYAGVSYSDFSIAISSDGIVWSEEYPCEMREGLCYRWLYMKKSETNGSEVVYSSDSPDNTLWVSGKYIRIHSCHSGLNLWEVVARGRDGNNLPLQLISDTNARSDLLSEPKPASNLIDESYTCVGEPSWYNGTYFDEIYYARTAYEHLHGISPYETTHPPLGKLLMALSVAVFGMTPFGWRFAGAMIGILMLPLLYLLAMQLTHSRRVSFVSMTAFALDLMHFTQTRLATIDSFPVFFILLSYFFMIRYLQSDSFEIKDNKITFSQGWILLFLCGISMGLSIASKWTGLYSAVGLAVLFFIKQFQNWTAFKNARELLNQTDVFNTLGEMERKRIQLTAKETGNYIIKTCLLCLLFFVLNPAVIYCLCYIPYLSPTGSVTIARIIQVQQNMLSYHSQPGLGMDHPFYSPWWQWPFCLKPMWFAQDHYEPAGYASTIVCMGNPWVFYIGAAAMALVLCLGAAKCIRIHDSSPFVSIQKRDGNLTIAVLCVAFLVQYLPWILVPRGTYIYHYFSSVPFIIMATAYCIDSLPKLRNRSKWVVAILFLLGALVFFIMFYPYASGRLTSTVCLDAVKWFKGIYY